jgi:hypothetical protein
MNGITDESVNSLGTIEANIIINNYSFPHKFHIVNNGFPIPTDGLIGQDFIDKCKCVLDYGDF